VKELKEVIETMKMQVKTAVETTVRDIVQRKYNVGDYPRQIGETQSTK
jgi:hypothetical protein